MKRFSEYFINEVIAYQVGRGIPFTDPVMRPDSEIWEQFINRAKELYKSGDYLPNDVYEAVLLESDIGKKGEYQGKQVDLDRPRYGGSKKFIVYTKVDGKVYKVQFGSPDMSVKLGDKEAVDSFVARHKCSEKKDKTSAGWWSCNLPAYAKMLGIENPNNERYW